MGQFTEYMTLILACLAALLSFFSSREARKSAQQAAKASLEVSRMQHQTQRHDLKLQYHNEIRDWATRCIEAIGEVIALSELPVAPVSDTPRAHQLNLVYKISSLIDSGRWFFPNDQRIAIGQHHDPAFRGARHKVLDPLLDVYKLGLRLEWEVADGNRDTSLQLIRQRRRFVSLIQGYVQTVEWSELIQRIDSEVSEGHLQTD